MLVHFGAVTNHCAFYPGAHRIETHDAELEGHDTGKGTICFQRGRPLPVPLVRRPVKTRIAEYRASGRHERSGRR